MERDDPAPLLPVIMQTQVTERFPDVFLQTMSFSQDAAAVAVSQQSIARSIYLARAGGRAVAPFRLLP